MILARSPLSPGLFRLLGGEKSQGRLNFGHDFRFFHYSHQTPAERINT